ncbi:unnamed protein product [Adineta ricciae]|uniref:Uncharacterized protein n=1 Tax=Adineta ricciae TaxID=249248 RepID=A0A814P1F8_ADIRI|nr:unnamed protein product [Adineta ricciae]
MLDDLAILVIIPLLSLMVAYFIEYLRKVKLRRQSQQIYLLMTQLSLNEEEAPPAKKKQTTLLGLYELFPTS